jgi:O-antigen ligase
MPDVLESRRAAAGAGLDRLLPFIAVVLSAGTMIQFLLPVGRAGLAVTVSDAVVAMALPVMGFRAFIGWRPPVESLVPRLPLWLLLTTAILIMGFVVGYERFGLRPWGATRVPGWLMLLGHLAVAAWIASDQGARVWALRAFVAGAALSAGYELFNMIFRYVLVSQEDCKWALQAFGAMQNPNALAMVLLSALAVAISPVRQDLLRSRLTGAVVVMLLVVGIGLTASRSAWVSGAAIVSLALVFGWAQRIQTGIATVIGVGIVVLLFTVLICGQTSAVADHAKVVVSALSESKLDGSNVERFYSWRRAFELFMAHPVFGAGFGAFLEGEYARGSTPLIIHSTPLWLLAEAGIVGAAAYLGLGLAITAALISHIRWGSQVIRSDAIAALLLTTSFALMSLAQEMLYQRCVWVVLGLLILHPAPSLRQQ